jgi:hypothetical protein
MKFCSFLNGAPHHKVSYVLRYKKQVSEWTIFFMPNEWVNNFFYAKWVSERFFLCQVSEWMIFFMPSEWVNDFFMPSEWVKFFFLCQVSNYLARSQQEQITTRMDNVLDQYPSFNSSPLVDIPLHSDKLSWFQAKQPLFLLLILCALAGKHQIHILVFCWTRSDFEPTIHHTWGKHANHCPNDAAQSY